MIFYFTGTGNSLSVAKALGEAFGETLVSIADEMKQKQGELSYALRDDERVFFVYPVHSWGPAVMVPQFIARLKLQGYGGQPVYSVCTCGDECGYTGDMLRRSLHRRGVGLTASYSVQMPNNYIILPGFNVDTAEVEAGKLDAAPARIAAIAEAIGRQEAEGLYEVGSAAFLKSYAVYPLFAKFAVGSNSFFATDACISCGLCERICPTGTITAAEGGRPKWSDSCVQCLACIHRCPVRAIEYGKATQKKGRYHHPGV